MDTVPSWVSAVCVEFDLDPESLDHTVALDIVRAVRRDVARPAAPVTAYLLGVAVGRGVPPRQAAGRVEALIRDWRD